MHYWWKTRKEIYCEKHKSICTYDLKSTVNKIKLYTIMMIDDIKQDMFFFVGSHDWISLYSIHFKCYLNVNWKTDVFVLFIRAPYIVRILQVLYVCLRHGSYIFKNKTNEHYQCLSSATTFQLTSQLRFPFSVDNACFKRRHLAPSSLSNVILHTIPSLYIPQFIYLASWGRSSFFEKASPPNNNCFSQPSLHLYRCYVNHLCKSPGHGKRETDGGGWIFFGSQCV